MSKNIKAVPTADYQAVTETAGRYVEGLRTGNAETVSEAFHKDAVMYGFTNGSLLGGRLKICTPSYVKMAVRRIS